MLIDYLACYNAFSFIEKIKEAPTDFRTFFNVMCGLHSGIPPCCVAFYVKMYVKIWHALPDEASLVKVLANKGDVRWAFAATVGDYFDWITALPADTRPHYIPCPSCVLHEQFVPQLVKCNCLKTRKAIKSVYEKAYQSYVIDKEQRRGSAT